MQSSTDQYIDYQLDEQRKRFATLRRQRTYWQLQKDTFGSSPMIEAALEEIESELNYE